MEVCVCIVHACVCASVRVCVCVCGLYIVWVHLWTCAKPVGACVRAGDPSTVYESGQRVTGDHADMGPSGDRLGRPHSLHPSLPTLFQIWGVLKPLSASGLAYLSGT